MLSFDGRLELILKEAAGCVVNHCVEKTFLGAEPVADQATGVPGSLTHFDQSGLHISLFSEELHSCPNNASLTLRLTLFLRASLILGRVLDRFCCCGHLYPRLRSLVVGVFASS